MLFRVREILTKFYNSYGFNTTDGSAPSLKVKECEVLRALNVQTAPASNEYYCLNNVTAPLQNAVCIRIYTILISSKLSNNNFYLAQIDLKQIDKAHIIASC